MKKGSIADLEDGTLMQYETLEQFCADYLEGRDMGGRDVSQLTADEIADMLCDEDTDIPYIHASSMEVFLQSCIFADEDRYYVMDEEDLDDSSEGA